MAPVSLSTLGDLKAANYRIIGHCKHPYCKVGRDLDLNALIDRLGENYVIVNETRISRNFLCQSPRCENARRGLRGGDLTISPPT